MTEVSKGGTPLVGFAQGLSPCGAEQERSRPVNAGVSLKGDGVRVPFGAVRCAAMCNRAILSLFAPAPSVGRRGSK
jgi:hypothetical protein